MMLSIVFRLAMFLSCSEFFGVVNAWDLVSLRQSIFSSTSSGLGGEGPIISPKFSDFVNDLLEERNIKGLTLSVIRKDGDTEYGAWGNRTEEGDATRPSTLFHLASCSKAFLATSFGMLIDDFASGKNTTALPPGLNELNWETKVKDIVPAEYNWRLMDEWTYEKVNIRDIFSHVSGIVRHDYSVSPVDLPENVIERMQFLRPTFELRQKWSYNNLMFMLGSHIITHYTGSYVSFVKERILNPLNMTSTTFSPSEAVKSGEMTQSWTNQGRRIPQWFTEDMKSLNAGPGGLISNVEDMGKWVKVLLNAGVDPSTNRTIIPLSVFDETTKASAIVDGRPIKVIESISGYGMGWFRQSHRGHDVISHSGGIPGFSTLVSFLPDDGLGVVVLINADDNADATQRVTNRVVDNALSLHIGDDLHHPSHDTSRKLMATPKSSTKVSDIALEQYAGTYTDPGYGSFSLCDPLNSHNSTYCAEIISDFAIVDRHNLNKTKPQLLAKPQLFASWSRLWSSQIRLVYAGSKHQFDAQFTTLFTHGYGADRGPFETFNVGGSSVRAEFVVEEGKVVGLGIMGTSSDLTQRRGGTLKDQAEVWFDKVY